MGPFDRFDAPAPRRPARAGVVVWLGSWLRATPAELAGLAVLLVGALAASVLLWWSATGRPQVLPVASPAVAGGPAGPAQAGAAVDAASGDAHPGHLPAPPDGGGGSPAGAGDLVAGDGPVTVHVSGAVGAPGLVELPAGSRVGDAVSAAGGAAADADLAAINLARPLRDGEQIHVVRIGEEPRPLPDGAGGDSGAVDADGRVDINRATAAELETLPGIGPARAAAIVEYREVNGPFREPGDLRGVSGIGERTFQNLADRVVVR